MPLWEICGKTDMARKVGNPNLDTRNARGGLKKSKAPYWTSISPGHSLGYRKGKKGGAWLFKLILDDLRQEHRIGPADDMLDADGATIFSFAQAQERTRKWSLPSLRGRAGTAYPAASSRGGGGRISRTR